MFERLIQFAIEQRLMVLLAVLLMAGLGVASYQKLPIDAVPDITNVQVQINTQAAGFSPLETEQRITFAIETAMAGLPGLEQTRSLSRSGLSQVTVIFEEGTDLFFARQLVNERLQQAREQLPEGVEAAMGPISTGLGEIFLWTVEAADDARKADGSPYTPTDLREIQDWIIKPQLRNVRGVAEINTIGGFAKEYQIAPDPKRLASYKLTLSDLLTALERNNANVGAGYIERRGEQLLIRAPGQLAGIDDIANIVLANVDGTPIRVRNVAEVGIGRELRSGAATENGREVVLGTVFMLIGENSRTVSRAVAQKLVEINRSLPEGVSAVTVYDRTNLVDKAIATVKKNLIEGAILVIVILFLFLGNIRAALITAMVIPLSMLFTFTGMFSNKVSANLMSLGALDFGIIVDGAVVIVENAIRRLAHAQQHHGRLLTRSERLHEVFNAAREARRPLIFGQLIIMVVYLPIFALSGVEGKMFHPMAFTVVIALLGAMLLSVTFVPAAIALFVTGKVKEDENLLMRSAKRGYAPLLKWVMGHRPLAFALAAMTVLLSGMLASRMGSEFVPSLSEGDFALQALRVPGTSLSQSVQLQQRLEQSVLSQVPEVERVFARTGTAEIASDPMPPNISDSYVMLKPKDQWPDPSKSREQLIADIQRASARVPGSNYELSQPIQLRFNELISGVRSDVAVKVFGDDMAVLNSTAAKIASTLQAVPGASEVKVEQTSGLPVLTIDVDRDKAARYGLNVGDVQDTIAVAVGGRQAGTLYEGDRRFDMVVRLSDNLRTDIDGLSQLLVPVPASTGSGGQIGFITLADVASLELVQGPNQVSREDGKRLVVVSANVRGRDIGSFVDEAAARINSQVSIPAGYWTRWGGQFEQLQSAAQRLQVVVPVALLLVFGLLFMMFNNLKDGLLVFTGIPFALTGGVVALWLRDIPLSISAGVGFIALSGVAVLNGLVMIAFIRGLREQGRSLHQAIDEGALTRLRPVLMTALVASLGFNPHGPGHRHRRRSAAAAGHRGDWRHPFINGVDPAGTARAVLLGSPQRRGGGRI
ncbi:UNVERIFIED_ORG: cobalt-zinc-cadmium resistance protein CzcA [Pseudomonas vranovensis]|nr:cobalt-zinc-cadmium resistance protein CzcA [Pseudomonas vranovensis]